MIERRPGLVDEDVVDLVHDGEVAAALHPLGGLLDHVVAQVVEAQFVVRAVRHVGGVGLGAGHRAQVLRTLVAGAVRGVEHEGRVVLDDPDGEAHAVEDRAHPLRVAFGQVVVGRHHMDAAAGHRVEGRRERRDEGLALAGLHLRDLALVEHHAAHQLDVEVAHAQVAPADLARRGEDLGQGVVEDGLQVAGVGLLARDADLPPALRLGMVQLVVGGFRGRRVLEDLRAQGDHALADLLVRERLELGLQAVDLVDERLQTPRFALAATGEARQQVLHGKRKYRPGRVAPPCLALRSRCGLAGSERVVSTADARAVLAAGAAPPAGGR